MDPLFFLDGISVFLRGLMLGVVVAAPVGPVGLLCIKRTLQTGVFVGLGTGLGAAIADTVYAAIAAFGVTAALSLLTGMEKEIRIFGGLFLLIMAIRMILKKVTIAKNASEVSATSLIKAIFSGFFITFSNPLTIIGILAVVATFAGRLDYFQALTLTAGIFCGSLAWWFFLCGGVHLVRKHFTDNAITSVNRGTAILLIILALWAIFTGFAAELGFPMLGPSMTPNMTPAIALPSVSPPAP
jgi:threonine/homoserine/homoserine lactone efflux protein